MNKNVYLCDIHDMYDICTCTHVTCIVSVYNIHGTYSMYTCTHVTCITLNSLNHYLKSPRLFISVKMFLTLGNIFSHLSTVILAFK